MYLGRISRLGSISTSAAQTLVDQIFQTDFGRLPSAAGLTFWINALQSGQATTGNVEAQILASAAPADLAYYNAHHGTATAPPPAPAPAPAALPGPVQTPVEATTPPSPIPVSAPTPAPTPTYKNSSGQVMPGIDYTAQIKTFYTQVGMTPTPTEIDSWNSELNGSMSLTEVQSLIAGEAQGYYAGLINTANSTAGATPAQVAAATTAAAAAEANAGSYVSTNYSGAPVASAPTPTPTPAGTSMGPAPTPTPATATIASSVTATQSPSVMSTSTGGGYAPGTSSAAPGSYAPTAEPTAQTAPVPTPGTSSIVPLALGILAVGFLISKDKR
jgi:hypothetical protein